MVQELEQIEYKQGMIEKGMKPEGLPLKVWRGAEIPADVRKSVFALVERMDREPDDVEIEDIMDMRSEIIAIGVVVSDQLPAIKALSTSDTSFSSHDGARNYLNCALVNM